MGGRWVGGTFSVSRCILVPSSAFLVKEYFPISGMHILIFDWRPHVSS